MRQRAEIIVITSIAFIVGCLAAFSSLYVLGWQPTVVAPSDFIRSEDISVFEDRIVISVPHASVSQYAPTGSMVPLLDVGANGIRIRPTTPDDIVVGDLVTFREGNDLIIHRVIRKGEDRQGIYFITKGDSNTLTDGKVRFDQIEYKTIALLY